MTLACLGLLVAAALPSWQQHHTAQRLIQATELFAQDLRSARSLTLLHNTPYYIHYDTAALHNLDGDDWCYVLSIDAACHCLETTAPPSCLAMPDHSRHWLQSTDYPGIHLSEAVFGSHNYVHFNPVRGTASFGHVCLDDDYNRALIINVSLLGRIRICRAPGTMATGAYPVC